MKLILLICPVPGVKPSYPLRVRGLKLSLPAPNSSSYPSYPLRVRGLKSLPIGKSLIQFRSYPLRVRGLKSDILFSASSSSLVVPLEGTWIEIFFFAIAMPISIASYPLRVRGLKSFLNELIHQIIWSYPLRVRGLKLLNCIYAFSKDLSYPLRVRGLKLDEQVEVRKIYSVVPLEGTWIEILNLLCGLYLP